MVEGKLTLSEDIYNRIKWDPTLKSTDFSIVYEDRLAGVRSLRVCVSDSACVRVLGHERGAVRRFPCSGGRLGTLPSRVAIQAARTGGVGQRKAH